MTSRLRHARRSAGLKQADLARLLGRDQSFVSKYETAERRIDLLETLDVCAALQIKLWQILPAEFADLVDPTRPQETHRAGA